MAQLFHRSYSKEELLRFAGNIGQIGGIDEVRYDAGRASGLKAYLVRTGGGLDYTVLPGKCLDIPRLGYHGVNLSFLAKPGVTSPLLDYPADGAFDYYVTGGMLFTSGLQNSGPSGADGGSYQPAHGRIGAAPAEHAYARCGWEGDDYLLETGGLMRESALFGPNLLLERKITSKLGENTLTLTDVIQNASPAEQEYMLLYHINFGFPFIDKETALLFPQNTLTPRTPQAKEGVKAAGELTDPVDGFFEHVFFRDVEADEKGEVAIAVENRRLGIGARLSYEKKHLPVLVEWKSMRSGDYALGLEPCNSFIKGRAEERKNGTLKKLPPFGRIETRVRLSFYDL